MGNSRPTDFAIRFDAMPPRLGTFCISRDLWNDPFFFESKMSRREAYIWMTKEAAWKARTVSFGGAPNSSKST